MNTFTVVVWEEIPENTTLYLIPNEIINNNIRDVLRMAHGHFVNQTDSEEGEYAALKLSDAFGEKESASDPEWGGKFKEYKFDGAIENKTVTHIYVSGFLM